MWNLIVNVYKDHREMGESVVQRWSERNWAVFLHNEAFSSEHNVGNCLKNSEILTAYDCVSWDERPDISIS